MEDSQAEASALPGPPSHTGVICLAQPAWAVSWPSCASWVSWVSWLCVPCGSSLSTCIAWAAWPCEGGLMRARSEGRP